MNAAVEVPTASMGFDPRSTSSMYTPGDKYDVAIDCSLPFGGWRPHKGGGLAWESALFPLRDDHRFERTSPQARELLARRRHDLRWLRLHPQLPGAHAARGWPQLIEHVDVPLAHALAAPELAAGEEARVGAVADGDPRALAEPAEYRRGSFQREGGIVLDRQRVVLEERIAGELFAVELRAIEEGLHAEREDLVLVGEIVCGGGDQVMEPHLQRTGVPDHLGLALLVGDLLLEVPVLVGAHVDGRADVVEVQDQARRVLAQELRGRRGQERLRLALLRRHLGAEHAEERLADVADDLVSGHQYVPLP